MHFHYTRVLASGVAVPDMQVCILTDSAPLTKLAHEAGLRVAGMKVGWHVSAVGRTVFDRAAHLQGVRAGSIMVDWLKQFPVNNVRLQTLELGLCDSDVAADRKALKEAFWRVFRRM